MTWAEWCRCGHIRAFHDRVKYDLKKDQGVCYSCVLNAKTCQRFTRRPAKT